MNNREWLYSLDVADLADWFDAEHVENQERALDGDTDAQNADSRELILTDLEKKTREWHDYDGNFMRIYSDVAYAQVKELLDRQAAITLAKDEAYCQECNDDYYKLQDEHDELQAQADEKWNLYVAEHRRADINAADREMYREATSALVDSITDGLRKVNSILDGKDEGLA